MLEHDTSSLSPQNRSIAKILQLRSRIALGQSHQVLFELSSAKDAASQAIQALAHQSLGNEEGLELARELAETEAEDSVVQVVCGTVLAAVGEYEKAVELLGKHQGNLEACVRPYKTPHEEQRTEALTNDQKHSVALLTHIHLTQNRTDLALKEVQAAKRWAQDSLLINLAEAWVGLRVVRVLPPLSPPPPSSQNPQLYLLTPPPQKGGEKYQSSYYIYEELASTPSTTSPSSLVAQAVADMHLNRLPEAEATLQQALELDPDHAQARANKVVLACLMARKRAEVEALLVGLEAVEEAHPLVAGLAEMDARFDDDASRYQARVPAAAAT